MINPGEVAAIHFTINGMYKGEPRICLEHVNRVGTDAAPDWPRGTQDDVYRVEIEGTPSITQETAFRFTDGSGRDAAAAGCLATGLRALNAVPAVNDLPARVGHRAGSAAHPRGGDHPLRRIPYRWARNGRLTADRHLPEPPRVRQPDRELRLLRGGPTDTPRFDTEDDGRRSRPTESIVDRARRTKLQRRQRHMQARAASIS